MLDQHVYLKSMCGAFGLDVVALGDYSETIGASASTKIRLQTRVGTMSGLVYSLVDAEDGIEKRCAALSDFMGVPDGLTQGCFGIRLTEFDYPKLPFPCSIP